MLAAAVAALLAALLSGGSPPPGGSPAPAPPLPGSAACGDPAADNYGPSSTVDPGDNRACAYSCPGLRSHFTLSPAASACYISDGGSGHAEQAWPPQPVEPLHRTAGSSCDDTSDCSAGEYCINEEYCSAGNNTFTVPSWGPIKGVIIQGYALAGAAGDTSALGGRTALTSRADALGADATLVLRHVSVAGLVAAYQPSFAGGYSVGGAVYVYQGTLTAEHALFVGNAAYHVSGRHPFPALSFICLPALLTAGAVSRCCCFFILFHPCWNLA
jgi:hypothetical protein